MGITAKGKKTVKYFHILLIVSLILIILYRFLKRNEKILKFLRIFIGIYLFYFLIEHIVPRILSISDKFYFFIIPLILGLLFSRILHIKRDNKFKKLNTVIIYLALLFHMIFDGMALNHSDELAKAVIAHRVPFLFFILDEFCQNYNIFYSYFAIISLGLFTGLGSYFYDFIDMSNIWINWGQIFFMGTVLEHIWESLFIFIKSPRLVTT